MIELKKNKKSESYAEITLCLLTININECHWTYTFFSMLVIRNDVLSEFLSDHCNKDTLRQFVLCRFCVSFSVMNITFTHVMRQTFSGVPSVVGVVL